MMRAQSSLADSLRERITQLEGVAKIEALRDLSEALENDSYEAALKAAQEAVLLSRELDDPRQLGVSLSNLAIIHDLFARYPKALDAFREAADLLPIHGQPKEIANNYIYMGMGYFHIGEVDSGLKYVQAGKEQFAVLKDSLGYSESLNSLGLIQQGSGAYTEATNSFFEAIKWAPRNHKSHIIGNIGILFMQLQEHEKALEYFHQCYTLEKQKNARIDIGYTLGYIGTAHYYMRQLDSAKHYYQQAIDWNLETGHLEMTQSVLAGMLKVLVLEGKKTEAFQMIEELSARATKDQAYRAWIPDAKWTAYRMLGETDSAIKYLHQT
ncbi:MAG: hypothetical protein AAFQ87_16170, partial [Bacteroidota bacterium]